MGGPGFGGGRLLHDPDAPKGKLKDADWPRIIRLFRPYVLMLAGILLLAIATSLIGLIPPLLIKEVIDVAIPQQEMGLLLKLVMLMVALPVVSGLLSVLQNHWNNKVGQGVMRDLRYQLFSNLQRQSMSFFTHAKSGEIIQRLTGDVQAVQGVVTGTVVNAITQLFIVITTVGILFGLDWKLSLLSMALLPLFVLPVRRVSKTRRRLRSETQKVRGEMSSMLGEIFGVSGAMLTRLFGREDSQERRFNEMNEKVMSLELKLNLVGRWFGMAIGVLTPLGTAIIYLYGGIMAIRGELSVGEIVAFVSYIGRLYGPISSLLNLHVEVATAMGIFERIFDYLDRVPDIQDSEQARPLTNVRGAVEFDRVSFSYVKGKPALQDISFRVEPGELVALVGPSGAGKSTTISMLARLYDPDEGTIRLDGRDLRDITLKSLRQQVGFVTQESFMFHTTVRENLLFAKEDATDEEIMEACRKAYIHDRIMELPKGYDTIVGERGHRFSGGERQRLAIARAILKDPRILVLDEATSHLDSESEAFVQKALEELMKNRTTIVIAHRLSTVLAADRILVLDRGRLVEEGPHEELLARNGLYARLYHTQFAKVEAAQMEREMEREEMEGHERFRANRRPGPMRTPLTE